MKTHPEIKILVIDDEPFIRESLVGFLEDCDFNISSADSAEQALNLLRQTTFDVAIVDLRLPGMNGDVFIQEINSLAPHIRFLIHTGSVDYHLSKKLIDIGVRTDHVFYKPQHDLTLFVNTIDNLFRDPAS